MENYKDKFEYKNGAWQEIEKLNTTFLRFAKEFCDFKIYPHQEKMIKDILEGKELRFIRRESFKVSFYQRLQEEGVVYISSSLNKKTKIPECIIIDDPIKEDNKKLGENHFYEISKLRRNIDSAFTIDHKLLGNNKYPSSAIQSKLNNSLTISIDPSKGSDFSSSIIYDHGLLREPKSDDILNNIKNSLLKKQEEKRYKDIREAMSYILEKEISKEYALKLIHSKKFILVSNLANKRINLIYKNKILLSFYGFDFKMIDNKIKIEETVEIHYKTKQ